MEIVDNLYVLKCKKLVKTVLKRLFFYVSFVKCCKITDKVFSEMKF